MIITFVNVARGRVSCGVPESVAGTAALLFDMSVVGILALVYAIADEYHWIQGSDEARRQESTAPCKHMPSDGGLVDPFPRMALELELRYKILVDHPARLYGF